MTPARGDYHGVLVVDKPGLEEPVAPLDGPRASAAATDSASPSRLYTSHDVVQLVRRWSRQRRIGHTGTLDPMASGVLVLCLGRATRLVEYYQGHDKRYAAEVTLGVATDTYDALGAATSRVVVPRLTRTDIEEALAGLRGPIMQRPPVYSALKQGGESLHRKARRGESVEIAPRPITVHALDLVDWIEPDRLSLLLTCSAGAYVRSLAHDLGIALGTAAHLSSLRRLRAGPFALDQAHALADIEAAAHADRLASLMLPLGRGLGLETVVFSSDDAVRLGHGQVVDIHPTSQPANWQIDQAARAEDEQGRFLGIVRCLGHGEPDGKGSTDSWLWKAQKWMAGTGSD